jgi:hypothetical protein
MSASMLIYVGEAAAIVAGFLAFVVQVYRFFILIVAEIKVKNVLNRMADGQYGMYSYSGPNRLRDALLGESRVESAPDALESVARSVLRRAEYRELVRALHQRSSKAVDRYVKKLLEVRSESRFESGSGTATM